MANTVATRAGTSRPSSSMGWAQDLKRAWGAVTISTLGTIGDTFTMCKLPKGAVVIGGWLKGDKIDSNAVGSACMSINLGFDRAVQTVYTATSVSNSSSSNALGTSWVLGPDVAAVTGYKTDTTGRCLPLGGLLLSEGPLLMTDETYAQISLQSTALGLTTGDLFLEVDYYISTIS